MTNEMKLLRAFIEASGYEIDEVKETKQFYLPSQCIFGSPMFGQTPQTEIINIDYKITKREFNSKPTLHKIIRQYEKEGMSASEMIGRIMLLEGVTNEDL